MMDDVGELVFRVDGMPAPQGSKSAVVDGSGRARVLEGKTAGQRAKLAAWRAAVAWSARAAAAAARVPTPLAPPVAARVEFRLPRPQRAPAAQRWHTRRPDIDKLARAVLDALVDAGVIADDSHVAELTAVKVLAARVEQPGASVVVATLGHPPRG